MFSTTDKTFHNHHFISTHCNYSRFPITRTLANSNQNRFPLDFLHTFPVILPSVIRTLNNSNLPLTRSNFCFPSDHLYINLTSKTRTIFWALIKSGKKKVYWRPKHWILNFPLMLYAYSLLVEANVVCHKSNVEELCFSKQLNACST